MSERTCLTSGGKRNAGVVYDGSLLDLRSLSSANSGNLKGNISRGVVLELSSPDLMFASLRMGLGVKRSH